MFYTVFSFTNANTTPKYGCEDFRNDQNLFIPLFQPCGQIVSYGRGDYETIYDYPTSYRNSPIDLNLL